MISIHALREEGDHVADPGNFALNQFLSTPSARRATIGECHLVQWVEFLSTPSARRATSTSHGMTTPWTHFYPRPPRGGRPPGCNYVTEQQMISIHALREEGDVTASEIVVE